MRLGAALLAAWPMGAATYWVLLAGLGGEPEYEQRFAAWVREAEKIGRASADAHVSVLSGREATAVAIRSLLGELSRRIRPEDSFVLLLVGHGSFDGQQYKFNIPGPDLSGDDLAALLAAITATRQLVVNTTSASGASLEPLRKPGRIVITATKSGMEKNATVFARYWIEALRDAAADADKNDALTALEAFRYASQKTARFYESQKRLATEHPLLEDTGQGAGVRSPDPAGGSGRLAAAFVLLRSAQAQAAARDPARRALLARKEALEQEIDLLKYRKAAMDGAEYRKRLTALLVELARVNEELEK
ncbi:MAG: hypothetical protein RMI94_04440 [Bryobacterales bacterium]|nr:hypothetical protein [Bryobacterales bacterium]